MKEVEVTGRMSGDCECFCFDVTEEEYRRIVGEKFYQLEKKYREEGKGTFNHEFEQPWRIYPTDLLGNSDSTVKVKMTIEKID